jgi:IclR family pca regulon transcriptional regulator
LSVLHAFDDTRSALTLTEIASRLGWSRTKPYRFVHTLEKLGYLARDSSGRAYRLTTLSMQLGFTYLQRQPLVELSQPVLERLRERVHASSHMAILEGGDLVYVALARIHQLTAINIHVGSRMPATASSIGRVLLAHQSETVLDSLLRLAPPRALTPKTTVDPDAFRQKLQRAREDGYFFNDEEFSLGIRSIAAPIFDADGQVVAGINATALTTVFTDARVHDEIVPAVKKAAADISRGLGWLSPRAALHPALRGETAPGST